MSDTNTTNPTTNDWVPRHPKTLAVIVGIAVLWLLIGIGIGVAASVSQRESTQDRRDAIIEAARDKAQDIVFDAEVERDNLDIDVQNTQLAYKKAKAKLRKIAREIDGYEANTFGGTGTYLVGVDVKPGTYKADASVGCYWARLRSLDTMDIINNSNADGPVVVELLSSDKAFEVNGCSDFRKVG